MIRACILGCSGPALTLEEKALYRDAAPWGFILFKRNIESPDQVRALTGELREAVGRADAPVLVDQEGGRVQRLGAPHWRSFPAGRTYGRLGRGGALTRQAATWYGARLIAHDLRSVGITVDCMPVLDVPVPGAHAVIGDRAYGDDPDTVACLGRAAAEGLLAGGVLPVMKHVPGHGRALADSHEALPVVEASRGELEARDFVPFRRLADLPVAMTAHVVYTALDPEQPATTSARVIGEVIRGAIGFGGLLLSDDLSMNALAGGLGERARAALRAGCDIALHCNGRFDEMLAVVEAAPALSGGPRARAEAALGRIAAPEPLDPAEAWSRLDAALASVA